MEELNQYAHLLLVEDDQRLSNLIQEVMQQYGFEVSLEQDGNRAVDTIRELNPDLVILDIMLPGKDGLEICRQARSFYKAPILFLTARGDQMDEILGLEIGADDYLAKPVEPRLLATRVRALLRRYREFRTDNNSTVQTQNSPSNSDQVGVSIHPGNRAAFWGDTQLDLAQPEYELLLLLYKNPGQVFSRDDLYKALRGIEYDGVNRSMDILVSALRNKLPDKSAIMTVRNKGYMLREAAVDIRSEH